jgi:DNA-binding LytR/AlgR family response regulator
MKYRVIINNDIEEDVLIYAKSRSAALEQIEDILRRESTELIGTDDDGSTVMISPSEIFCVSVEDGRAVAITKDKKLKLRQRLYQLEELFGDGFLKINQSCIVRISAIERFEPSFSGALNVRLKNGFTDYVSRRQMKKVKERLGF